MARYIDADRFIEWLDVGHLRTPYEKCHSDYDVKEMIDSQQTAEVQEVRHGHWIKNSLDNSRKFEYSCSICGWSGVKNYDSYVDIHDFEYCPYCGAKMDEEEQE